MRLLVDENIHGLIAAGLAAEGHELTYMSALSPTLPDDEVLAVAVERDALLLTNDLDFGELVYRQGARHTGVLLLRLGALPYAKQAELVARVVASHASTLGGAFSVLTPARLRTRGPSRPAH